MGSDKDAVVDPRLRFNGIAGPARGRRSVMPSIIGGNTNAPVRDDRRARADFFLGKPALPARRAAARERGALQAQSEPQESCLMAREHMKSWQVGDVHVTRVSSCGTSRTTSR
jgi:hypothetical protein